MKAKTFKAYLKSLGRSENTIESYNNYLLDFMSLLDNDQSTVAKATTQEVTRYLEKLSRKRLENKTKYIRLNSLQHYYNWQIQLGNRDDNPVKPIKIRGTRTRKLYDIFSMQELEQLYYGYEIPQEDDPRHRRNWWQEHLLTRRRNKVMLGLIIYQGLTTAEIDRITADDLQLRKGNIFIRGGRKSNERILELKSHQIMELMEYQLQTRPELLRLAGKETTQLFASKGKNVQSNHNWKNLSQVLKETHKKFKNFKQVRASVITHWLGIYNLREVQYMAGHRYVSSTENYFINRLEDLQNDIDKYHPRG